MDVPKRGATRDLGEGAGSGVHRPATALMCLFSDGYSLHCLARSAGSEFVQVEHLPPGDRIPVHLT